MALTAILVSGGAIVVGTKAYRAYKKKRNAAWFDSVVGTAQKSRTDKRYLSALIAAGKETVQRIEPNQIIASGKATWQRIKPKKRTLFSEDVRRQQLKEIIPTVDETDISGAEKKINRHLAISLASLGLATTGSLLYPPLSLLSVPGAVYICIPFFQKAYQSLFKEGRAGVALVDSIAAGGLLAMGYYFAASLAISCVCLSRKLLIKTEDRSRKSLINVFGEQPRFIWIQQDGVEVEIPFEDLKIGDTAVIDAGQTIPVDGLIASGVGRIDQRMLTGESQPVEKGLAYNIYSVS